MCKNSKAEYTMTVLSKEYALLLSLGANEMYLHEFVAL